MGAVRLAAAPVTINEANRYVHFFHRHTGVLPGAKFVIAAIDADSGTVHGVAVAGPPKATFANSAYVLEVHRVCTDGTFNCCSFLYGHCKRAAHALGYRRIVTYTLLAEPGSSLKASGWTQVYETDGSPGWQNHPRPGFGKRDNGPKIRWEIELAPELPPLSWPEEVRPDQLSLMEASWAT